MLCARTYEKPLDRCLELLYQEPEVKLLAGLAPAGYEEGSPSFWSPQLYLGWQNVFSLCFYIIFPLRMHVCLWVQISLFIGQTHRHNGLGPTLTVLL